MTIGLDEAAMAEARARLDRLTKPPGSLGRLEELVMLVAGITARAEATVARPAVVVAAADHGVARQGVSAYPQPVTAQMVANFLAGGAAISVLARHAGASVTIVDVGVVSPIEIPAVTAARLVSAPVAAGTADMTAGPAMAAAEVTKAIDVGRRAVDELIDEGADVVAAGEMGIGNTTSASAIVAALTGASIETVTGRGTGIDDAGWARKVATIRRALDVNRPNRADPLGVLAAVGGLEIAALVGVMEAAAMRRIPVVLDGFITAAAALIAVRHEPAIRGCLIASHRSVEPGHAIVLDELGLRPLLELDLRLGEGTGAALALGLLRAATAVRDEMATFESAAISGPA